MIGFKRLTHEDYGDIVDISKDIWDGFDYLPQVFHDWVDDEGYFLGAVDLEKNKVIGVGKFSILYDRSGWLEGLRVHVDYRGQKIARLISERLVEIAKEYLEESKIKRIAFSTHISNTESSTLMKKMNFQLESQYIIITKSHGDLSETINLDSFQWEGWELIHPFQLVGEYISGRSVRAVGYNASDIGRQLLPACHQHGSSTHGYSV